MNRYVKIFEGTTNTYSDKEMKHRHNADGPAVKGDGKEYYYIDDQFYTNIEYDAIKKFCKKRGIKI